jgi:hypothetical protein
VPVSGAGVDIRRVNSETLAALEAFSASPLLASGQISLMSLDAILERLGLRWAARRESVYDYAERTLTRYLGERGHFVRVSETDYLVAVPGLRKYAAQLQCLRCLREVLTYFLGEPRPIDLRVLEVTRITRDGLEAVLVNPVAVAAAADREQLHAAAASAVGASLDAWTPFATSDGRRVRVSCALEPVVELKGYKRIGNRIVRRVLWAQTETPLTAAELKALSRSDIEKIDCATVARGLDRMRAEASAHRPLSIIVPVSYVSLSNRQSRARLARLFAEAKRYVTTGIICEVCDIEDVPQGALLEATSLIKPYCVFIIGCLGGAPDRSLGNLRGTGLQALAFEAPQGTVGDAEFLGWARTGIDIAKAIARSVLIYHVSSPRHIAMAALLGASHASLRTDTGVVHVDDPLVPQL